MIINGVNRHRKCGCKWKSRGSDYKGTIVCDKHMEVTTWMYMSNWISVDKWKKPKCEKCRFYCNPDGHRYTKSCKTKEEIQGWKKH